MKTLAAFIAFACLAGIASACSSGSSSGGFIAPTQVDSDGPTAIPPPPGHGPGGMPGQPPENGPSPQCPSYRDPSETTLDGAPDVRARLVGLYSSCSGGTGLEIRLDRDSDTRLVWYALDSRYVRLRGGAATSGWMDIGECDGAVCTITWHSDGVTDEIDPERELTIWSEPTAFTVATDGIGQSWSEYLRIAE
jgi:hypothetical protein